MEAIWVAIEMRAGGAHAHSVLAVEEMEKMRPQLAGEGRHDYFSRLLTFADASVKPRMRVRWSFRIFSRSARGESRAHSRGIFCRFPVQKLEAVA